MELNRPDSSEVQRVTEAINRRIRMTAGGDGRLAVPMDARVVEVPLPRDPARRVGFLAELESMDVALSDAPAKVIVNARTGSVVMNQSVVLAPSAVAHGNLSVTVSSTPVVSQPGAFSGGQTVAGQVSDITVRQEGGAVMMLPKAAQLKDLVRALNTLGATPHSAGAAGGGQPEGRDRDHLMVTCPTGGCDVSFFFGAQWCIGGADGCGGVGAGV